MTQPLFCMVVTEPHRSGPSDSVFAPLRNRRKPFQSFTVALSKDWPYRAWSRNPFRHHFETMVETIMFVGIYVGESNPSNRTSKKKHSEFPWMSKGFFLPGNRLLSRLLIGGSRHGVSPPSTEQKKQQKKKKKNKTKKKKKNKTRKTKKRKKHAGHLSLGAIICQPFGRGAIICQLENRRTAVPRS